MIPFCQARFLALFFLCLLCSGHAGSTGDARTILEQEPFPDMPDSAYIDEDEAPKVGPQPRDPGAGEEEETEWGMGVNQREFENEPRNTVVHCDGPHCSYSRATLPGSRGYKGSFFPVDEIEEDKALVKHLIASLHQPCKSCSLDQEDEANKKSCEECTAKKTAKVKAMLEKVNALRRENAEALKDDQDKNKKTPEQRQYSDPFNSTGTLAAPANAYLDLNELHCGVSKHSRTVCSMCGGPIAYRVRGYRVEVMSPREQRFVPSYPFADSAEQRRVRGILKATAPESVTTMSLAGHGEVTCVASSPAPMVTSALAHLGVNMTQLGWTMRGMPTVGELGWTPTLTIRIDQRGREEAAVPASFREGGAEAAQGRVQSVAVMFAMTRQPWGGATEVVPMLRIHDTVGEIEVWDPWGDGSHKEVHQYINGSIFFGDVSVPVLATQPAFAPWGTVTGQIGRPLSVGQILQGFGCGDAKVRGGRSWNCDSLALKSGPLRERLQALGMGEAKVTDGAVESSFGGQGEGKVLHKVAGSCSVLPESKVTVAAAFSRAGEGAYDMHWVWTLEMVEGAALAASALLSTLMGTQVSSRIDSLHMKDLAIVVSGSTVTAGQRGGEPADLLMQDFGKLRRGVSVRGTVMVGMSGEDGVSDLLEQVLGAGATVPVQGLVGWDETSMLGHSADLRLSGGVRMSAPVMRVTVRRWKGMRSAEGSPCTGDGECEELEAGFQGQLLVPVSALEAIQMEAYAAILPKTPLDPARLELVASMEGTLPSVFGVSAMHLSFAVVKQRVYGSQLPRIIADGVLSVGAACSVATMDVAQACMEGRATVGFTPADASNNLLAGRLPSLGAKRLLRLAGVRDASWGDCGGVVRGTEFPYGSGIGYALRDHHFMARESDSVAEALFSVPQGMSGDGVAAVQALGGVNCSMRWNIDEGGGRIRMEGEVPSVQRAKRFELSRGSGPFHGGADKGPVLKIAGVAGKSVQAWLQGYLSVGNLSSFVLIKVSDLGMDGRVVGRFGGAGLHCVVRVTAALGDPQTAEWKVSGEATETGLAPVREKLPGAILAVCTQNQEFCTGEREAEVSGRAWLSLCSLSFHWKVPPGDEHAGGLPPGGGGQVLLTARVTAYGRKLTVHVRAALTETEAVVSALAAGIFHTLMGMEMLSGDAGEQCEQSLSWRPFALPAHAATLPPLELPTSELLRGALEADNAGEGLRREGGDAFAAWEDKVAGEREACAVRAWEGRKEAFEWDQSVLCASEEGRVAASFSEPRPTAEKPSSLLRTDAFAGGGKLAGQRVVAGVWRQGSAHGVGEWIEQSAKSVVGDLEREGSALLKGMGVERSGGSGRGARGQAVARVQSAYHQLQHRSSREEGGRGRVASRQPALSAGWAGRGPEASSISGGGEEVGATRQGERDVAGLATRELRRLQRLDVMAKRLREKAAAARAKRSAAGLMSLGRLEGEVQEREREVDAQLGREGMRGMMD